MNTKKINLLPLDESLEDNFFNEKCNILINNGNEFLIDLNPSIIFPLSPNSKNSNFSENNNNNYQLIKNIDLKYIICNSVKEQIIQPEMILLYTKIDDKYILLNDYEIYSFCNPIYNSNINNSNNTSGLNSEMRSTGLQNLKKVVVSNRSVNNNNINNNIKETKIPILYYKICKFKQRIMIDIFQNKIDKIIMSVPICCSVYMLKVLIFQKLKTKNLDFIKNQNLYGVGFLNKEKIKFINKALTNKKFTDNYLIYDIMKYYLEPKLCSDKILNLILIEKNPSQCLIGLDFKFNIMKNFKKLENFDSNAPSYRNVSDGLNLFIYCLNKKCQFYNSYFTLCKGYGIFDILQSLEEIKCPFCHIKNCSLRNIGMINLKWTYKGFLKSTKESKINGDGITLSNDKLYIIKEIIFEKQFLSLLIEVEFYQIKTLSSSNNKNSYQSSIQNINGSFFQSDISDSDLINLNLEQRYLNNNNLKNKSSSVIDLTKEFTFQKPEKINENNNIINYNDNNENNDNDIIKLFHKKDSNESKKSDNNKLEIDIKLDCKKEPCCLECGRYSNNYSCILW